MKFCLFLSYILLLPLVSKTQSKVEEQKKIYAFSPFIEFGGPAITYNAGLIFPLPQVFRKTFINGSAAYGYTPLFNQGGSNIQAWQLNIELIRPVAQNYPRLSIGVSQFKYLSSGEVYYDSTVATKQFKDLDYSANVKLGYDMKFGSKWRFFPYIMYVKTLKTRRFEDDVPINALHKFTPTFPFRIFGGVRLSYTWIKKQK